MEMKIRFPGNKKVMADFNGYSVVTDQPEKAGGDGSAPSPMDLFLTSLGTCAGFYVMSFCQKRSIPTDGIELIQRVEWNHETHMVSKITLEIHIPRTFPEKYRDSLVTAADLCTVKRHLIDPPRFEVLTKTI